MKEVLNSSAGIYFVLRHISGPGGLILKINIFFGRYLQVGPIIMFHFKIKATALLNSIFTLNIGFKCIFLYIHIFTS